MSSRQKPETPNSQISFSVATNHTIPVQGTLSWHLIIRAACWRSVVVLSVRLRRGFRDEVGRINWGDLGHKDELSANGLICGPRLKPANTPPQHTHTLHLMAGKFANTSTNFAGRRCSISHCCRGASGSVELSWYQQHSRWISSLLHLHLQRRPPPTLSLLSSFLLCSLPVRETDVHCELERQWRLHHQNPPKISTRTKTAQTMGCFQMATNWS